ncbi:Wzz/FepE/Etk N-terminal domain-containing protein [Ornithinimicrobium faecis]|uniref:Wzz/FepE/Etk N-terminal domain-containing protein n=1 Tax=Ornithinimicrobium faecis TaxID=2934158 RepID=UPI0021181646|nr:Wzz/FepE/Etk N-terminal domain-containing protein [Ornithinimicrobium sp. HY1745]
MSARSHSEAIDLGWYWTALIKRWWLIALTVILGVGLAGVYLVVAPKTYSASATLSVVPITSDPYAGSRSLASLVDMSTEAVIASSFTVAERAAETTDGAWQARELQRAIAPGISPDNTTITITVTAPSPERAQEGAAAVADAYLIERSEAARENISSRLTSSQASIKSLREQLADANERAGEATAGSQAAAEAETDIQLFHLQISSLLSRVSALEGVDTTGGAILNPVESSPLETAPNKKLVIATGFAAGLGFGMVLALVLQASLRNTSIPRFEQRFNTQLLGGWNPQDVSSGRATVQRILRSADVVRARRVALVFVDGTPQPEQLAEALRDTLGDAYATDTNPAPHFVEILPETPLDVRLERLRTSDSAIVLAPARLYEDPSFVWDLEDIDEMGTTVIGAVSIADMPVSAN